MSAETNKQLIAKFNACFETSDIDAALSMMSDDCQWWILGKADLFPVSGTKSKTEFGDLLKEIHSTLQGGMRFDVVGLTAEGDQVAAELRAQAVTKSGKIYENNYHMLYRLRDGHLCAVREYTDLMTIRDIFYGEGIRSA